VTVVPHELIWMFEVSTSSILSVYPSVSEVLEKLKPKFPCWKNGFGEIVHSSLVCDRWEGYYRIKVNPFCDLINIEENDIVSHGIIILSQWFDRLFCSELELPLLPLLTQHHEVDQLFCTFTFYVITVTLLQTLIMRKQLFSVGFFNFLIGYILKRESNEFLRQIKL
jgi:hypothetical protein